MGFNLAFKGLNEKMGKKGQLIGCKTTGQNIRKITNAEDRVEIAKKTGEMIRKIVRVIGIRI